VDGSVVLLTCNHGCHGQGTFRHRLDPDRALNSTKVRCADATSDFLVGLIRSSAPSPQWPCFNGFDWPCKFWRRVSPAFLQKLNTKAKLPIDVVTSIWTKVIACGRLCTTMEPQVYTEAGRSLCISGSRGQGALDRRLPTLEPLFPSFPPGQLVTPARSQTKIGHATLACVYA
jgi:hypothetical protein